MNADDDAEFSAFVRARWPAFARTAYLLCAGDLGRAEDLVQTALARTMLAWPRLRDRGNLDGYVYRVMVRTQASWWQRRWHGERPTDVLPEPIAGPDQTRAVDDADQPAVLWRSCRNSSARPWCSGSTKTGPSEKWPTYWAARRAVSRRTPRVAWPGFDRSSTRTSRGVGG